MSYLLHTDEVGFVLQDVAVFVLTDDRLLSRLDVKVDQSSRRLFGLVDGLEFVIIDL